MDCLTYIFTGAVQGLTEFLPVSSSGHTFLLKYFFGLDIGLVFEAWLHLASLLAVVWFFRGRLIELVVEFASQTKAWIATLRSQRRTAEGGSSTNFPLENSFNEKLRFSSLRAKGEAIQASGCESNQNNNSLLMLKLLTATLLTLPIALLIDKFFIKSGFLNITTVAITLFITGILILLSDKIGKENKKFIWPIVIAVGLIQGLAVIPGISRAGLTIALLILLGLKRRESVEISFLLAIPTILGAFIFSVADIGAKSLLLLTPELVLAFIASFLFSILSIKYMLKWVQDKWIYFAFYCFAVSIIIFYFSFTDKLFFASL